MNERSHFSNINFKHMSGKLFAANWMHPPKGLLCVCVFVYVGVGVVVNDCAL